MVIASELSRSPKSYRDKPDRVVAGRSALSDNPATRIAP